MADYSKRAQSPKRIQTLRAGALGQETGLD
jgi:hypothetical protein